MKNWLVFGRSLSGLLAIGALVACGTDKPSGPGSNATDPGSGGGSNTGEGGGSVILPPPVECDSSIEVASNSRALVVTDPEVLARFSLDRVLAQMLEGTSLSTQTPLRTLQGLFDTENTNASAVYPGSIHCDDAGNPAFFFLPAGSDCGRAEGALASDDTLLSPGNPNAFVPVAIVNRFDLMRQGAPLCGEFRIVYAKESGKTNPDDRVFLIFEGALLNPTGGDVLGCLPVARFWADVGKEADVQVVADDLDLFFFTGLEGFAPVVHREHFGAMTPEDGGYSGSRGQVRIGQKMQLPWAWREFRYVNGEFLPTTTKNNPVPAAFDVVASPADDWFRQEFMLLNMESLSAAELHDIRMKAPVKSNVGQSAFDGEWSVNYYERASGQAGSDFATQIQGQLDGSNWGANCPPADPLTAESILQRATMQTCAGCHAPQEFLNAEGNIGCGLTWPKSLGEVHISETGELSPALLDVFLPRRAEVLTTFAQACDMAAIDANLMPADDGQTLPK